MRVEIASSHVTGLYKRRAHSLCNKSQVKTPNYRYWGSCAAASSYHGSCLGACITNTQRPFCRYQYTNSIWHQYTTSLLNYQYDSLLSLSINHLHIVISTHPPYGHNQYTTSVLTSVHLPNLVINTPPTDCRYQYTTYLLSLSTPPTVVINKPPTYCYQYTSSLWT